MRSFDMLKPIIAMIVAVVVLLPAVSEAEMIKVEGTVTYRERIALPPDATVEVLLVDISVADAPSKTLAESRFQPQGQVPIPFTLEYDSSAIQGSHSYALQAGIRTGDRLWFSTATKHSFDPAKTEGHDIVLTQVRDPKSPAGSWLLESIQGSAVQADVKSTMDLAEDGTLSGSGGCNRLLGKATLDGTNIKFGNIASTQMACSQDEMDQEHKFFVTLDTVREWRLDPTGTKLTLLDETGNPALTFVQQ